MDIVILSILVIVCGAESYDLIILAKTLNFQRITFFTYNINNT